MAGAPFALDPLLEAVRARSTGIGSHIHGEVHWRTVGANGLWLAESVEGADADVVLLFALLHDTMRLNDGHDPEHGRRAAVFAGELHAEGLLELAPPRLDCFASPAPSTPTARSRPTRRRRLLGRRPARPPARRHHPASGALLHRAGAQRRAPSGPAAAWVDLRLPRPALAPSSQGAQEAPDRGVKPRTAFRDVAAELRARGSSVRRAD